MSSGKQDGIPEYSADYRGIHPDRPATEKSRPKQAGPARKKNKKPVKQPPHPKKEKPADAPDSASQRRPPKKAGTPPRPVGRPAEKPAPLPEAVSDPMDNDAAIDDFLPAEDHADDEQFLTKWDAGESAPETGRSHRKRGKYRYGIFVGSLVLLLALVGVGFIATSLGSRIHSALTDDSALRAYDRFLTVVVAQDPKPFASPDKAGADFVLNTSLWQAMSENASDYTSYDSEGRTLVPLGDVADACRELFGPDCELQPKNPASETFFTYDSGKTQFHVSMYSLDSTYEPYTEKAKKNGEETVLRVGYIPPSDPTRAQSGAASAGTPKPSKYMEYVLKTNPSTKKEYIYSVRKAE